MFRKLYRVCLYLLRGALISMGIGVLYRALLIGFGLRSHLYWGGPFDAVPGSALLGALLGAVWYYEFGG